MNEDELESAWKDVLDAWDDDAAHKRFLILADSSDQLAEAGRLYRELKARDASRSAAAQQRINEILAKAVARMKVARTPVKAPIRSRVEWVGFGLSAALI